jgi:phosphate transport system permease protein
MVIGNSVVMPTPLTGNPLTYFLSQARTLTGNIAVEIGYATGIHESALFATGVVLFALIIIVNATAHWFIRGQKFVEKAN